MKSFAAALLASLAIRNEVHAFSSRSQLPPPRPSSGFCLVSSHTHLYTAAVGRSNPGSAPPPGQQPPTLEEQTELEPIRVELIQKYIALGHSEEYATREVNYFLADSERSSEYLEMRKIAAIRGNDLGIESVVQFGAAFLVGMVGSLMMNSWNTYQAANPDGGLPWI